MRCPNCGHEVGMQGHGVAMAAGLIPAGAAPAGLVWENPNVGGAAAIGAPAGVFQFSVGGAAAACPPILLSHF